VEKTRGEGGDDLDPDGDVDMEGADALGVGKRKRVEDEDDASGEEGEDGYYELVKRAKKEKKQGEKREYDEARMADRCVTFSGLTQALFDILLAQSRRRGGRAGRTPLVDAGDSQE
jgi:hypothetical protein